MALRGYSFLCTFFGGNPVLMSDDLEAAAEHGCRADMVVDGVQRWRVEVADAEAGPHRVFRRRSNGCFVDVHPSPVTWTSPKESATFQDQHRHPPPLFATVICVTHTRRRPSVPR